MDHRNVPVGLCVAFGTIVICSTLAKYLQVSDTSELLLLMLTYFK